MIDDVQSIEMQAESPEIQEQPIEQAEQVQPIVEAKDSDKERNLRNLREAKERAERERDEYAYMVRQMQTQSAQPKGEDDIELDPDGYVEWKHVEKKLKNLENKLQNYQQYSQEVTVESRLRAQYPDFDQVVSRDNIETLRNQYPDIAQTLTSSTDMYSKGSSAYTIIKRLIGSENNSYEADKQRIQRNASKPKPLASLNPTQGDSPLSHANAFANGLTDDLKKSLYKEMMEIRKGY